MTHDQVTREYRSCHAASLDAEIRAMHLAKVADSITPGMSLGHLDELMRGLVVERMIWNEGHWVVSVRVDGFSELPRTGLGATMATAIADAVRSLATMQTVRAAEKRKMAARWLESLDMAEATAMDDLHPTHEEKAV